MLKRQLWLVIVVGMLCLGSQGAIADEGESNPARIEGWSVGVAIDSIRDNTVIGGRLGYWWQFVGVDARAQFGFYNIDDADTNSTIEKQVGATLSIGAKGGLQVGPAKWYGRVGVGFEGAEHQLGPDDEDQSTESFISGEAGGGVDMAVSERLILGLNLLTVRVELGEFNVPKQEPTDLFAGNITVLGGAHISFQF